MQPVERVLTEDIAGDPREVRDSYVDFDAIAEIHPLVVSVRTLMRRETPTGYEQIYRIKDLLPVRVSGRRLLRMPISYTAQIWVSEDGPVRSVARQFPGVRLESAVSFAAVPGGTRLTERILISAPRPLLGITVRRAVAAHLEMLAGLRRRFERRDGPRP